MTAALPNPIELAMPAGDAEALTDVARAAARAARCLTDVDDRLIGAAVAAPGWLGDDAAAAAAQVGAVVDLVRAAAGTVLPAAGRLSRHAERVLECRRQVEALRAEQREQFREAHARWAQVENLPMQLMNDGPGVRAIVDDVEAGEASRRRRHTALLEELEDDAAATARVLADSCAVVGGRGASGDASRVIAYLAAQLPGWGELELARRGRALAERLIGQATGEERVQDAADATPFADQTVFANALLAGLGPEGVIYLLTFLGNNEFGVDSSVARLLAAALGAAVPSGGSQDLVGDVLRAEYVQADDRYGNSDTIANGLAMVLVASRSMPSGGLQTSTLAEWSRQLLLREHEQRAPAGRGSVEGAPEVSVPTELAVSILADRADPDVSAALLTDPRIWEALLQRFWGDDGVALGEVVLAAGRATGEAGAVAVRAGLQLVGADLVPGDPSDRTVSRATVDAVSPALARAAAGQVQVVVDSLSVGVDGRLGDREDVLRGLGYVTLDPTAAAAVDRAVDDWSRVQPTALDGTGPLRPLPAVAVPAAFIGVREYGQRLAYALDGFEAQHDAENAESGWNCTVGLPAAIAGASRSPWGTVIGLAEGYGKIIFGADGTWENGVDGGMRFSGDDAAAGALAALAPQDAAAAEALTRQARAAYERTMTALGTPRPPTSPESDLLAPLVDAAVGKMAGQARDRAEARIRELVRAGS